jgi:hypothetical protein
MNENTVAASLPSTLVAGVASGQIVYAWEGRLLHVDVPEAKRSAQLLAAYDAVYTERCIVLGPPVRVTSDHI